MSVRHAEKSRVSTCVFADQIASLSIEFAEAVCEYHRLPSTHLRVIASFVLCEKRLDGNCKLKVVSYGEGTKFISQEKKDKTSATPFVRDSHAEILAKRALQRWLLSQVEIYKKSLSSSTDDSTCYLKRNETTGVYSLRDEVTLHFYTSSTPCGNSTLKKFYSGKNIKAVNFNEFGLDEWPQEEELPFTNFPAIHKGQIAVLVKRNAHLKSEEEEFKRGGDGDGEDEETSKVNDAQRSNIVIKEEMKSRSVKHQQFEIPIGTELPQAECANILTCSDKISLWNCLGVQGALLSHIFDVIKPTTMTIGRKFTRPVCERALLLRLQSFNPKYIREVGSLSPPYRISYPPLLCSSVKLTNEVIDTKSTLISLFDSISVVWFEGHPNPYGELIDGKSGYLYPSKAKYNQNNNDNSIEDVINDIPPPSLGFVSAVADKSIYEEFKRIVTLHPEYMPLNTREFVELKLLAKEFQVAKRLIFTHKKLFGSSGFTPLCLYSSP